MTFQNKLPEFLSKLPIGLMADYYPASTLRERLIIHYDLERNCNIYVSDKYGVVINSTTQSIDPVNVLDFITFYNKVNAVVAEIIEFLETNNISYDLEMNLTAVEFYIN